MFERRSLPARILLDLAIGLICVILTAILLPSLERWAGTDWQSPGLNAILPVALVCFPILVLLLIVSDLYDMPRHRSSVQTLRAMVLAFVLAGMVYFAASLFISPLAASRKAIFLSGSLCMIAFWIIRSVSPELYGHTGRRRRVLLIGAHTFAIRAFQRYAHEYPDEIDLVGIIDNFKKGTYFDSLGLTYFGNIEALGRVVDSLHIDTLVVLNDQTMYATPTIAALENRSHVREVYVRAQIPLFMAQDIEILFVQEVPLLKVYAGPETGVGYPLRPVLDRVAAAVGLLLLTPVFLIVPVLMRLDSPGPVFYRQRRLGIHNRPFWIYKFRSMVADAERASGAVLASKNDPRVTKLGRFMRATRVDEIPQLINVFKGEMSLIGPRPERPEFQNIYLEAIPWYPLRSLCRPGLTGLAQVSGDYHTSSQRKLLYDVTYLANLSPLLDLRILVATVVTVLTKRGH